MTSELLTSWTSQILSWDMEWSQSPAFATPFNPWSWFNATILPVPTMTPKVTCEVRLTLHFKWTGVKSTTHSIPTHAMMKTPVAGKLLASVLTEGFFFFLKKLIHSYIKSRHIINSGIWGALIKSYSSNYPSIFINTPLFVHYPGIGKQPEKKLSGRFLTHSQPAHKNTLSLVWKSCQSSTPKQIFHNRCPFQSFRSLWRISPSKIASTKLHNHYSSIHNWAVALIHQPLI